MAHLTPKHARSAVRYGFTLVELLVVIAIIGTLVGMLLPAVVKSRESARRAHCSNNCKQMHVGLSSYESARRRYPPGSNRLGGVDHAWSSYILPYIEQQVVWSKIDFSKHWNAAGGNDAAADFPIPTYVCASGILRFAGKQDYGGIMGSPITPSTATEPAKDPFHNGLLYAVDSAHPQSAAASSATDGLNQTLIVGESVDRGLPPGDESDPDINARWANGQNCFSQNSRFINCFDQQNIRSNHPGVAHGVFAGGAVVLLSESMHPDVLAAICTRNGGESIGGQAF